MLKTLRPHLPARREAGGVRGSLRWLEAAMQARGANPASLRNIVYRGVGTPADKKVLHAILTELYQEAGLTQADMVIAPLNLPSSLPAELELLGRSKKRVFRSFMNALAAGRTPRVLVVGKAGVGKTVLIEHLEREVLAQYSVAQYPAVPVTRLLLGKDWSAALGNAELGSSELHVGLPFALQAEQQAQAAARFLQSCLQAERAVVLIRLSQGGQFGSVVPRQADGTQVSSAAWAVEHLLGRAPKGLSVLLALEETEGLPSEWQAEAIVLSPPTPSEACRYVMSKLAVDSVKAGELVQQTGRHLDRLALLVSAQGGQPLSAAQLLAEPLAARLLAALQVVLGQLDKRSSDPRRSAPRVLLEAALGLPLERLPPHIRALLDEVNPAEPRPISLALLSDAAERQDPALLLQTHQRLAEATTAPEWAAWHLPSLIALADWPALLHYLDEYPASAALIAPLWTRLRQAAAPSLREDLARWVVKHYVTLGRYDHPQARDALFTLLESPALGPRVWAKVKLAESSVDAGNLEAAADQLIQLKALGVLTDFAPDDTWRIEAQADALLVEAALKRWQGDLSAATKLVEDPRTNAGGARATLWRGIIAKDAGRWADALNYLTSVPPRSALLFARARAQEGDLRLRLGQASAAQSALDDACTRLRLGGAAPEERARVEARAATALRRSGQPQAALERSQRALALLEGADDPVLRARLLSESIPLRLALGQWPEALAASAAALTLLTQPSLRQAEAAYRLRRTHYRTALIYMSRGLGLPYLHPFRGPVAGDNTSTDNADLRHARQLLDGLLSVSCGVTDREQVLVFDMYLSRALCEPQTEVALHFADLALKLTDHPYAEAQARAIRAEVLLRGQIEDAETALREINRAHALLRRISPAGVSDADPGLQAQLLTLEARATLCSAESASQHQLSAALLWLQDALTERHLAPFRVGVLQEVGRLLEGAGGGETAALAVWPALDLSIWRLTDALPLLLAGG